MFKEKPISLLVAAYLFLGALRSVVVCAEETSKAADPQKVRPDPKNLMTPDGHYDFDHPKLPKQLQSVHREWSALPSIAFTQFGQDFADLRLEQRREGDQPVLNQEQEAGLNAEFRRFLQLLHANSFENYCAILRGDLPAVPKLTSSAKETMLLRLQRRNFISETDSPTESELLKTYWIIYSNLGRGREYFPGIKLVDSYYQIKQIGRVEELAPPSKETMRQMKTLGIVGGDSAFDWGASAADALNEKKSILMATVRAHLKTSRGDLSYPMLIDYYWLEDRKIWIPHRIFQLYLAKREVEPIY